MEKVKTPVIIAVVGALCRGKSTVAKHVSKHLSERFGFEKPLEIHSTDSVRNEFIKKNIIKSDSEGVNKGVFSPEAREKVYKEVLSRIALDLKNRRIALTTGTYAHKQTRFDLYNLAKKFGAKVIFVECLLSNKEAKARLKAAEEKSEDRFGSLVGLKRYKELEKNKKTSALSKSPLLVKVKTASEFIKGGKGAFIEKFIVEKASLREFKENNAEYIPFSTGFKLELLPERTRMLANRIMDLLKKTKKE